MKIFRFFLLFFLIKLSIETETQLKQVQILLRHGDRTPIRTYPYDLYNESTWDKYGGFGQLTQAGMNRTFQFGVYLKDFYGKFLPYIYNQKQVSIRSSDYDRTLMSAASLLAGLFPPTTYQVWNNNLNWQPIPVHTTDADKLFHVNINCPLFDQLKSEVKNSPEFINFENENKELVKNINMMINNGNISFDDIEKIGDGISIEKQMNLNLPNWVKAYYDKLVNIGRTRFYFDYFTTELAKLESGALLNLIRKNIIAKVIENSLNRLFLISGHDNYLAALIKLLGIENDIKQPPYVAAIIIELHESILVDSQYFIKIYLKNNTIDEEIKFHDVKIKGCTNLCPLEYFLKFTENLVVEDFEKACKINKLNSKFNADLTTFYTLFTIVAFISIMFAMSSLIAYRRYKIFYFRRAGWCLVYINECFFKKLRSICLKVKQQEI